MATNVFASRYTARQVEEALERAMSAVQSINGQTPGVGGDVFVEALKLQKGDPASVDETRVFYAASSSGKDVPTGPWSETVPTVPQGEYLWTRVTVVFNSGEPVVFYSVSRMGMDGHGSVAAVNGVSPTSDGNVRLTAGQVGARPDTWLPTAQEVGALPASGGTMTGGIDMGGQPIAGLPAPKADADGANKGYVDAGITGAKAYAAGMRVMNLLDNSDFRNPVSQAGVRGKHGTITYALDRWILTSGTVSVKKGVGMTLNGAIRQKLEFPPTGTVSAFVGMAEGTASVSYAEGAVTITSAGGVLKWAALYEGEYTAETMPPYVPKGYGAELAACQRYFVRMGSQGHPAWFQAIDPSYATGAVNYPVTMRKNPTISAAQCMNLYSQYIPVTSCYGTPDGIGFIMSDKAFTVGQSYCLLFEASADLV